MAMKKKGYAKGGAMKKKKGMAKGGAMKKKGMAKGGAMKKKPIAMKKGSKLKMVEKNGKKVPFFAADGVGKMKKGGATKKKGMAKGGAVKKMGGGMMKKKSMAKGGVVKKGVGGKTVKKKMPKNLHRNLSNPNAGSGKNRDGIPLSKIGKAAPRKAFRPMTKAELEKSRADKRRAERKKSGQLSQAKKTARRSHEEEGLRQGWSYQENGWWLYEKERNG